MKALVPALALASILSPVLAQDQLVTTISWYQLDAYCAFQRAGERLTFRDPDTWDFVFFSQFSADGDPDTGAGFIAIQHRLTQLELLDTVQGKDGQMRHYRSYGAAPYDVTLTMSIAATGEESTNYRGNLTVTGPAGTEALVVEGSCGV